MEKLNGYDFLLKIISYQKYIMIFGIVLKMKDFGCKPIYNKKILKNQNKVLQLRGYRF